MSLWKKIENFVHGTAVKVSDAFIKIFGKDAAHQFTQGALSVLKSAEGKIALDAVEAVESLALDGTAKRAAAFEKIATDFKTQGISAADSIINLLIETAVAYLKGNFGAA